MEYNGKRRVTGPAIWNKMAKCRRTKLSADNLASYSKHPAVVLNEEVTSEVYSKRMLTGPLAPYGCA